MSDRRMAATSTAPDRRSTLSKVEHRSDLLAEFSTVALHISHGRLDHGVLRSGQSVAARHGPDLVLGWPMPADALVFDDHLVFPVEEVDAEAEHLDLAFGGGKAV